MEFIVKPLETSTPAFNTSLNESSSSEIESIHNNLSQETKILMQNEKTFNELSNLQIENQNLKGQILSHIKKHEVEKQYFDVRV